jgi:4-carboxymuconolactone decarboxylase
MRGLAVLREMHAPAQNMIDSERYARQTGPLGRHARDTLEFGYGHNWDENSLSLREKHLMVLAAFIAMERGHELDAHLKFALDNGVKREDFEPMLALLTPFVGLPAASNAAGKMHCLVVASRDRPSWCPPAAAGEQK